MSHDFLIVSNVYSYVTFFTPIYLENVVDEIM